MKTIAITELRQRVAEVIDQVRGGEEPVAILRRSRPVAYLVSADAYDRQLAELAATRRALFLREVREAEAEYRSGGAAEYDEIDSLLAELRP